MLNENEHIELNGLISGSEILEDSHIRNGYSTLIQAIEQSAFVQTSMSSGVVIANPSSNGYTSCALVALKSNVRIADSNGNCREESLKTFLENRAKIKSRKDEFVTRIMIPESNTDHVISGFKRIQEGDSVPNSIVSLAYHFQLEEDSTIKEVGIAICTKDNQIHFVEEACNFLHQKRFDQFNDFKLLADIIMTYTEEPQDFEIINRKEVMINFLYNLFKSSKEVVVTKTEI